MSTSENNEFPVPYSWLSEPFIEYGVPDYEPKSYNEITPSYNFLSLFRWFSAEKDEQEVLSVACDTATSLFNIEYEMPLANNTEMEVE